ncbi:hypothetical protein ABTY98_25045 [Streptomyces sp. NPDC096040]|uniref:hypothetical protein n=1 Tax=Streptomyces sp. NPDC096040 TaxID=3155541 RepID=UPI00332C70DD
MLSESCSRFSCDVVVNCRTIRPGPRSAPGIRGSPAANGLRAATSAPDMMKAIDRKSASCANRIGRSMSHSTMLPGRYSFAARSPHEGLRPLRDPATVHLDEDDDSV